jgi:hypothetical protein
VTLDGRPVTARGSLVLQVPLHNATYRLAATTGARRATAHLHIVLEARTTDAHAVVLTTPDIATFALLRLASSGPSVSRQRAGQRSYGSRGHGC